MTELLTAAQMRAIEQAAIESGEVTGLELMERAGRGVVEAVFEEWPELAATSHRAVVLCGPGNNGGDGFVVARLLKEWGWEVEVFFYGDAEKLPPDARVNYDRWVTLAGTPKLDWGDIFKGQAPDLLVDAVFGTGLQRALPQELAGALKVCARYAWKDWSRTKTVSVDCPSGLDCDSGEMLAFVQLGKQETEEEPYNLADLTVSFHSPKVGHYLKDGPNVCGRVCVVDIGIWGWDRNTSIAGIDGSTTKAVLLEPMFRGKKLRDVPFLKGMVEKGTRDHKYSNGHAIVLTGGPGKTGAARLAARGALRIGAGLVTLGVPGAAQMEVAAHVISIMLARAGTTAEVASVLEDDRINAVCLGPGLGLERAEDLVTTVLGEAASRPTVLDADALSAFTGKPDALFDLLHEHCVLTPHGGEFARLFPDIAEKLNATPIKGPAYSKVDATREAAKRAGCIVLFKGPDTVIAAPDGRCAINAAFYERVAPWLATAGSGDVLAGFITGLLARGLGAMQAAETAAWLHVECARRFGPGLIAEDLPEELPGVFRDLGI